MKNRRSLSGAIAVLAAVFCSTPAAGQNPFPESPARDTLFRECAQCHSVAKVLETGFSDDDWEFIVYDMIARGAPVHEDEVDALIRYLRENFTKESK